MIEQTDQPALRAALTALEREAPMPAHLVDDALAAARNRGHSQADGLSGELGGQGERGGRSGRTRMRWWAPVAGAAAAVAALAVAVAVIDAGHTPPSTRPDSVDTSSWLTYSQNGFSVRYPAAWRAQPLNEQGSFITGIVSLSTADVPAACTTVGNQISCGPPLTTLTDGGVHILWTQGGGPTVPGERSRLDHAPGTATRIDNRPAKIAIGKPDTACIRSHGNRSVLATIATDHSDVLTMSACIAATGEHLTELTKTAITSARTLRDGH